MYSFESRVRYSEVGENALLTLPAAINYFQDCSNFQSDDGGVGIDYLMARHRLWVLSNWEVFVNRYPKEGEKIKIGTWAYDFKSFLGFRNFAIFDEKGEVLIGADTLWIYLDSDTMKPVGVPAEEMEAYPVEERLAGPWQGRKFPETKAGDQMAPVLVKKDFLDTNHHVNNQKYIKLAMEYMAEPEKARYMRVAYKNQAHLGDQLYPLVEEKDGRFGVNLNDADGTCYATVEIFDRLPGEKTC